MFEPLAELVGIGRKRMRRFQVNRAIRLALEANIAWAQTDGADRMRRRAIGDRGVTGDDHQSLTSIAITDGGGGSA